MEPWFGNHGNLSGFGKLGESFGASMEPWFGNHGNKPPPPLDDCGRDMLQWSRGSVTTETDEHNRRDRDMETASMEPWFGNHGNPAGIGVPLQVDEASMEPWFGNHGNRRPSAAGRLHRASFNGAVVR